MRGNNFLKNVVDKQNTNKTCRLCLKPGTKVIFYNDNDFDVAKSIKSILGVEVLESDGKPQHICNTCEATLRDADRLKQTAEVTQWRLQQELEMVANTSLDDNEETYSPHGGHFVEEEGKIARRWSCENCLRRFDVQSEYIEHEKQPSWNQLKSYICEICGVEFKTLARLKRHGAVHSRSLPHACAQCPYSGRTPYALRVRRGSPRTAARTARLTTAAASVTRASASNSPYGTTLHRSTALQSPMFVTHVEKHLQQGN